MVGRWTWERGDAVWMTGNEEREEEEEKGRRDGKAEGDERDHS